MKKIVLIILMVFLCPSMTVDAKLKFGKWSKWDNQFPPIKTHWDSINYSHAFYRKLTNPDTGNISCVLMNCHMCKDKKCLEKASIILFSSKDKASDEMFEGKGDYQFALVAFPPDENNKMTIRTYKKEKKSLEFIEEWWEIPYENHSTVSPLPGYEDKFTLAFKEWVIKEGYDEQRAEHVLYLKLVIFDDKNFAILLRNELEEEKLLEYLHKKILKNNRDTKLRNGEL